MNLRFFRRRRPAGDRPAGRPTSPDRRPIDLGSGVQAIAGLPDSWDARLREHGLDPADHRVVTWHCPLHLDPADIVATFRIRPGQPVCSVVRRHGTTGTR